MDKDKIFNSYLPYVLIVIIIGYWGYTTFFQEPNEIIINDPFNVSYCIAWGNPNVTYVMRLENLNWECYDKQEANWMCRYKVTDQGILTFYNATNETDIWSEWTCVVAVKAKQIPMSYDVEGIVGRAVNE